MKKLISGKTLLLLFILLSCQGSKSVVINDFFGVRMDPKEQRYFRVVAYEKEKGASYTATVNMNPEIYAWAEFDGKDINLKIVNGSDAPLLCNYLEDQFSITLKSGETFIINKGRAIDYPVKKTIQPQKEANFAFKIPAKFWETVGMDHPQSQNESYTKDFWTGLNTVNAPKKNIERINILLGGKTSIVLKLVPDSVYGDE